MINAKIYAGRVNLPIITHYFDLYDYENPVKTSFDDRFSYRLTLGYTKVVNLYVKRNFVSLQDSLIQWGQSAQEMFYSIDRTQTDLSDYYGDGTLFEINLVIDPSSDYYERTVYSLLDMTGQVGGLYEVVKMIVGGIVGYFANKLFIFSIMNKLYQVDSSPDLSSKVCPDVTNHTNNGATEEVKTPPLFDPSKQMSSSYLNRREYKATSI